MEGKLPCNAFCEYRGDKYPIHIDRVGRWWHLGGERVVNPKKCTLSSSVAEVDDGPAWVLHALNMAFIQREAEARGRERRHWRDEEINFNDL